MHLHRLALDNDPYYTQLLLDRSDALFLTGKASIESQVRVDCVRSQRKANNSEHEIVKTTVISEAGLANLLDNLLSTPNNAYIFVPQANSWSPLQLSLGMYQTLCRRLEVFPDLLDVLSDFGVKTSEVHEESPISCQRIHYSQQDATGPQWCEIGYKYYHVEKHGRPNLKDPWSIRQTAVYQKFSFNDKQSTWIMVQLAKPIRETLEKLIAGDQSHDPVHHELYLHPIEIHILILTMSQRNWKFYIQYLAECLESLRDIACFSEVNYRLTPDYPFNFTDCQTLALLQAKISRCISILQSHADTLSNLTTYHAQILQSRPNAQPQPSQDDDFTTRIKACHTLNTRHIRHLTDLHRSAESTRLLLHQILTHRNDALLHANGLALQDLAHRSATQSQATASLTELARRDSRIMRIVAFVAMVYLPVGLVSAFFSSNIIQLVSRGVEDAGAELQREVGIFATATVVLTGLTVVGTVWWERRERRADAPGLALMGLGGGVKAEEGEEGEAKAV